MSQPAKPSRMPISVGSLLWIALIVWLVVPAAGPGTRQLEALRGEVAQLRKEVGQLRASIRALRAQGRQAATPQPPPREAADTGLAAPAATAAGSERVGSRDAPDLDVERQ